MKLRDIANNILKDETNEDSVDLYTISEELGINGNYDYYTPQDRLKCYYFAPWLSTDTWCGGKMYFLDDEPVCYSIQEGRKYDEEFFWFGKEEAKKVKDYIISLKIEEDELYINIESLDKEIGDSYKVEFNCEVFEWNYGLYNGKPFKFIKRIIETPNYGIDRKVLIEQNGKEFVIDIKDIDFRYWIE